jgi:hypothetical protein
MKRRTFTWRAARQLVVVGAIALLGAARGWTQELGGAGTVQGTVKDPTGGQMAAVTVELSNPVSGLKRSTTTDSTGRFVFRNLPPNPYHVAVSAQGFAAYATDVDVRSAVPIDVENSIPISCRMISPVAARRWRMRKPRRSISRLPTCRTTSRRAMRASSSVCVSTTTMDW